MTIRITLQNLGVRGIAFYAVVLVGIAIPAMIFGPALGIPIFALLTPSPASDPHLLHGVGFFLLIWTGLVGMLTQLYKPHRRVAGLQQTLVVFVAFLAATAIMGPTVDATLFADLPFFAIIFGPAVVAALLHPTGRKLLRTRTAGRFSPALAGLAVVAAIPLAAYAVGQFGLQGSGDMHAVLHHYGGQVVYSVVIVALGLLASLKPIGWRIPLFSAVGMAVLYGAVSVLHPAMVSSAGTMWGGAAIAWAILFAVVGEMSARKDLAQADIEPEPDSEARAG